MLNRQELFSKDGGKAATYYKQKKTMVHMQAEGEEVENCENSEFQ